MPPQSTGQTNQNYRTLIYFDSKTPESYLSAVSGMTGSSGQFSIKLCDLYGSETLERDLPAEISGGPSWLVTTRLDNDDGLNCNFVDWLHREVRVGETEVLNFPMGLVYHEGKAYLSCQESNAFISLSEPTDSFRTVVAGPHNKMAKVAPVRNIEDRIAWLQLIHGVNVSNKSPRQTHREKRDSRGF